jgi:hypothetical protein
VVLEREGSKALRDPVAAAKLFGWLGEVFNGDMFRLQARLNN